MELKEEILRKIPSVDRLLKDERVIFLERKHLPPIVKDSLREVLDEIRKDVIKGVVNDFEEEFIFERLKEKIIKKEQYSLKRVINATGIVIHTNLGRSCLPLEAVMNILQVALHYSNLEYDLEEGKRGKRYTHIVNAIKGLIPVEGALVVNNNAAAVFVTLNTLAKGKEVIVSRGELVEIGGSFRIPDVMSNSGAILKEVGTTNKTKISDYENAINENTALLLKVHRSNFKIIGFTEEVSVRELVELGRNKGIPVMVDLGSGCLVDLKKYGFHDEPTVQEVINQGADIVTFSGDKLLGSTQAGFILGRADLIEVIAKNPLMRALRVDKLTIASLEATLRLYLDEKIAIEKIPTLNMLTLDSSILKKRALKLLKLIKKEGIDVEIKEDVSMPGGGSLPEHGLKTYVVALKPSEAPQEFIKKLRLSDPPVIARIKDDLIYFDVRTVREEEIPILSEVIKKVL